MQKNNMRVLFTEEGFWPLDNERGKTLVIIELRNNNGDGIMHYCPTHENCEKLLRSILEAELQNDNYEFKNPINGNKYHTKDGKYFRPPQLNEKIVRIENIIEEYKQKNGVGELKKIDPSKCIQIKLLHFIEEEKGIA